MFNPRKEKEKYGFVYIWRDRKHKRYYIGAHWGTEDDGYICSSSWMKQAYKHRPLDFKRRILVTNIMDRNQLFDEEFRWLQMIKTTEIRPSAEIPKYYNFNIRRDKLWYTSPEGIKTVGQKISFAQKGTIRKPCSEETKERIRKATTGVKKTYTEESHKRLVDKHTGRKHTEEWKQENARKLKQQWADGTRKGYEHSEEHKRKMSEKMKGHQLTIPTPESREKQKLARLKYWENVKAGLVPPRKPKGSSASYPQE